MIACPACGHGNDDAGKFCSECGAKLTAPTTPSRQVRKTVTVVFCDVTGSTALGERLDPETLRDVMSRYFDRTRAVLESHGGTVEKFIGDAVMAVFGIPVLHEDDALRAVRAAHEMRGALAELNEEFEREFSVSLVTRIGVNTGPVVAGDPSAGQNLVTGDTVNTAARLEQAAGPGEILIGEATFHLARDAVDVEPVDPLALKGKAAAVDAYRLISVRAGAAGHERRLDSPMVGRERPLRMLVDAFEAARIDGACHLFTVLGPAGIGKSRLVREFTSAVDGSARVLFGRCLSYGDGIAFWPITEITIAAAGIAEDDPPDRARAAIRAELEGIPDADLVTSHLAGVIGLEEAGPVEAPWAVRRFFEAIASRTPLIVVFDDIHWAEPALLDVIEHVADRSRDVPMVLLCMARPEFLDDRPGWGGGMRNATSVHLEPLSELEADALIENLLGHPALTQEIRERIRAAAQGNPLFVEEMLGMLLDDGVLVLKEGEWVAAVDLTTVQVPPAISALLTARLDRLSVPERTVLETASIVGEVFERSTVRALVPETLRPGVDGHLGALLRKDLVRPSHSDVGGDEGYRFRHILLRDAAYGAVPKADRAELHEAFANRLVTSLAERAAEFDEFVGYHLEQAHHLRAELGLHGDRTDALGRAAFERLSAAGERAFNRGSMAAAASLLGHASALLEPDDPARLAIAWRHGRALAEAGELVSASEVLEEAVARGRAAGERVATGHAECTLLVVRMLQDPSVDIDAYQEAASRLIDLFEELGDDRGSALAWEERAYALWLRMHCADSGAAAGRALAYARACGDALLESEMLTHLLATRYLGPTPIPDALLSARELLDLARERGSRRLEAGALRHMGNCLAYLGDFEAAHSLQEEGRAILLELGQTIEYHATSQGTARLLRLTGDLDGAAGVYRDSCEQLEALGETAFLSTNAGLLAVVETKRGDLDAAERWVEVAERTASSGDIASQAGIELARGLICSGRGDPSAQEHLRRALELDDSTDMLSGRAETRLDVAEAQADEDLDGALAMVCEAIELARTKEAPVIERRAEELLARLGG